MKQLTILLLLGLLLATAAPAAPPDTTIADRIYVDETEFNVLGYRLLDQHRVHHAIQVFRWNVALHPDAWNPYDSLGEAYMRAGKHEKAIRNYEKSLDLNPDNDNARRMLDKLRP